MQKALNWLISNLALDVKCYLGNKQKLLNIVNGIEKIENRPGNRKNTLVVPCLDKIQAVFITCIKCCFNT